MVEAIVQTIFSKYLDPFFYGFKRQNLNVQLLAGKVTIFNIGLHRHILDHLNLPIDLVYSYVEKLEIVVPWRQDEVTLTINITNIYAIGSPKQQIFNMHEILQTKKQNLLKNIIKQYNEKKKKKQQKNKKAGHIENLINKLLDNIQININTIHIRYQSRGQGYSFGLLIKNLQLLTVDKLNKKYFYNRDDPKQQRVRYLLQVQFLGVYFNSKQKKMLSMYDYSQITKKFKTISVIDQNIHNFAKQSNRQHLNFILNISISGNIIKNIQQNRDMYSPLLACSINFNLIQIKVTHDQYVNIRDVINYFMWYKDLWNQFVRKVQLHPVHIINSQKMVDMLAKKQNLTPKQKDVKKRMARKFIGWAFKRVYQQKLKKKFISECIKKQIITQNLIKNKKILSIIKKIRSQKLQLWLLIALKIRQTYQQQSMSILVNFQSQVNKFISKTIHHYKIFQKFQPFQSELQQQIIQYQNQRQIYFQIDIAIRKVTAQISKQLIFGVSINFQDLILAFCFRKKNFQIFLEIQDFGVFVFSSKNDPHKRTYVSVIERSLLLQKDKQKILKIRFQQSPFSQSLISSQTQLIFKSIQISIYPQAFRQFYQIFFSDSDQNSKKSKGSKSKAAETIKYSQVLDLGIKRNKIKGKVNSPWIVFPLSQNNDKNSQCWVVRLGDLLIKTPDYDPCLAYTDRQLYYQHYKFQLRHFDLKYFSSINYFHMWIKFNNKLSHNFSKLHIYQNQKYIQVINPISCNIELSLLKKSLTDIIRQRKQAIVVKIQINQIVINLSKFLLNKMKQRVDLFGKAGDCDFIEYDIKNLMENNQIQGYNRISYKKIVKLKYYLILQGNYLYFFLNENSDKYHFFLDIRDVTIKITSNHISTHNQSKKQILYIYMIDLSKHSLWKKNLTNLLTRKQKIINNYQRLQSQIMTSKMLKQISSKQQQQISTMTKMSVTFTMGVLAIKLINDQSQFLSCVFQQTQLVFQQDSHKRQVKFSIRQWLIVQPYKDSAFLSSKKFFKQQKSQEQQIGIAPNFLNVQVFFNEITGQLNKIKVIVQKLFIAWNVDMFTKILLYFFYSEEAGDLPPTSSPQKRKLQIDFQIKKFHLYMYQNQSIIGLIKLNTAQVNYQQSTIQQYYQFNCQKFQMDRYISNKMDDSLPILICKPGLTNKMNLTYHICKNNQKQSQNAAYLKSSLGSDIIVPELKCTWGSSIIYYQNQQTMRLLNFFLNKILGTVGAKFKKKVYSTSYIFQIIKIIKISTFNVLIKNLTILLPPHDRVTNVFEINIEQLLLTKNIKTKYQPNKVIISTINQDILMFYQTMIYQVKNCTVGHKYGSQPSASVIKNSINLFITHGRVRFPTQFFPILKNADDFDRTMYVDIQIASPIQVKLYKIYFITILQVFYQNIKHKDGKADLFEPPLPYPSLKLINIKLDKINLDLYQQIQQNMEIFSKNYAKDCQIEVYQKGQFTRMKISAAQIQSEMQLPASPLNKIDKTQPQPKFKMQMQSSQGLLQLKLYPQNYRIQVVLDNLQNVLSFIKYNNDYVSNQLMPKKLPSLQHINVFPKNCSIKLGKVSIQGSFCINYLKNCKSFISQQVYEYIGHHDDIIDRQIRITGQQINCYISNDPIGKISYLYYQRYDYNSKKSYRQYKKQRVQLGQSGLYIQLCDLKTLYQVFQKNIRKNQLIQKQFYQAWNSVVETPKSQTKRIMEIQINKSSIYLMPTSEKLLFLPHFEIEVHIPNMFYATQKDQQHIRLKLGVLLKQINKNLFRYQNIFYCRDFQIYYKNYKDRHQKSIEIQNGKNGRIFLHAVNYERLAEFIEEVKNGDINGERKKYGNIGNLYLINDTNENITIDILGYKNVDKIINNVESDKSVVIPYQPLKLLELIHLKTKIGLNKQYLSLEDLSNYDITFKNHQFIKIKPVKDGIELQFSKDCILTNNTDIEIIINQTKKLLAKQRHSISLSASKRLEIQIQGRKQLINLQKSHQEIFNGYLNIEINSYKINYININQQQIFYLKFITFSN